MEDIHMLSSKYTVKQNKANKVEALQEIAKIEVAPKKEVKKRGPRKMQTFHYRGEPFVLINDKDLTIVCTVNQATKTPAPRLTVPRGEAKQAVRALAKIIIAENELNGLSK